MRKYEIGSEARQTPKLSYISRILWGVGVALAVVIGNPGCATIQFPDVSVRPASEYHLFVEKGEFRISVEPFLEKERVKELFGINLLSEGIVPVLVVAENHNSQSSFLLKKTAFLLEVNTDEHIAMLSDAEPSKARDSQKAASGVSKLWSVLVVAPPLMALSSPVVLLAADAHADADAAMHNLVEKELMERTLPPGEFQHGFIYFKLPTDAAVRNITAFSMEATEFPSRKVLTFRFPLEE